jgi:hypothetical protein
MFEPNNPILLDGSVKKVNAVATIAPKVIIRVTSLNFWVLSIKVLIMNEPITPETMYIPPRAEFSEA